MSSFLINIVVLLAALVVGYGVITSRSDSDPPKPNAAPALEGYYLRNALITETTETGAERLRVAAKDVQQNTTDNSVRLATVDLDYWTVATSENSSGHWTISADRGELPTQSDLVLLNGNVRARTVDAARPIALRTPSLEVDTEKQTARTDDSVAVEIASHVVTGQGLSGDLPKERLHIGGTGALRLAARPAESEAKISIPSVFEHEGLELRDGGIRLSKVRSRTPPFVQADEALASNTDLDNNRFTLRGNVHFDLPEQGTLAADSAVAAVRNSQIVHAEAFGGQSGEPVRFEHQRKARDKQTGNATLETAKGEAQRIDYDVPTGIVTFKGNVWFSTGRFEWRGEEWRYNLIDGTGSSTQRSTTTVHPKENAKP